jgi:hypothetical protein
MLVLHSAAQTHGIMQAVYFSEMLVQLLIKKLDPVAAGI